MLGVGYDTAGNQTTYGSLTLEYDAESRISVVKNSGSPYVSYAYDGEGWRVKKAANGVTTYYVYDALGRLAVEYSDEVPTSQGSSYLFTDMLGSVRTITDQSGAVVECYDYLPFGRMLESGSHGRSSCYPNPPDVGYSNRTPQKFTGKERDNETGLDYFGARYFSAPQGRFTSVDPKLTGVPFPKNLVLPQSWNMYAYTMNNPLKYVDPKGEDFEMVVMFQGEFSDEEKKKILKAIKGYLSKLDIGDVVVRQAGDEDKRTFGQKMAKQLFFCKFIFPV